MLPHSHPAIVSKEVYDLVQLEFEKRKKSGNYKTTASIFSGMMFCGDCGSIYGSKVWHSNTKHRKTVWQCNSKFKNEKKCTTPHLTEEQLKSAFIDVFNSLIKNKEAILNFAQAGIENVINGSIKTADKKIKYYTEDYNEKRGEVQKYIDLNRKTTIPQEEYNLKFDELMKVYKKVQNDLKQAENEKTELIGKIKQCNAFIDRLKEQSQLLAEFDEELFAGTVDKIVVYNECLIFIFRDGREITYPLKMANNSV